MTRMPDGLPLLRPGRHHRKHSGVCLMEYTSILAGEHFSDHPRCTDPVLATVARAVNDYSTDKGRQRLAVLASDLTAASPAGGDAGYALARRCLLTALLTGCIGDVQAVLARAAEAVQARGARQQEMGAQVPSASCAESSDTSASNPRST